MRSTRAYREKKSIFSVKIERYEPWKLEENWASFELSWATCQAFWACVSSISSNSRWHACFLWFKALFEKVPRAFWRGPWMLLIKLGIMRNGSRLRELWFDEVEGSSWNFGQAGTRMTWETLPSFLLKPKECISLIYWSIELILYALDRGGWDL